MRGDGGIEFVRFFQIAQMRRPLNQNALGLGYRRMHGARLIGKIADILRACQKQDLISVKLVQTWTIIDAGDDIHPGDITFQFRRFDHGTYFGNPRIRRSMGGRREPMAGEIRGKPFHAVIGGTLVARGQPLRRPGEVVRGRRRNR